MNRRVLGLGLAAFVFMLDQLIKYIVMVPLDLKARGSIEVIEIFNLTWVENWGISLGMLTADSNTERWLLVAMTALITVGVLVWLWREQNRQDTIALGLILGGATGNILDRIRFGHVVDYADLHFGDFRPFLVFNVADAAITFGVILLLVRAFLMPDKKKVEDNA